jgi:hypothetical protein
MTWFEAFRSLLKDYTCSPGIEYSCSFLSMGVLKNEHEKIPQKQPETRMNKGFAAF